MHGSTLEWLLKIYPSSSHQNVQIPPSPQFITFWLWHIHFSFAFILLRLHKQLYMLLYGWLGFFEAKNSSGLRWTLLSLADAQEGHRPLLKVTSAVESASQEQKRIPAHHCCSETIVFILNISEVFELVIYLLKRNSPSSVNSSKATSTTICISGLDMDLFQDKKSNFRKKKDKFLRS